MITKPLLPPKVGYVEVEINGVRRYKNAATGILLEDEIPQMDPIEELQSERKILAAQIAALSEQNDFKEELIVELANIVYA